MLIQSGVIQADQSAPLVAAEVRAAEARHGTGLPQFDGKVVAVAYSDPSGGNAPPAPNPNPAAQKAASPALAPSAANPAPAEPKQAAAKVNETQDARVAAMLHRINQGVI